MLTLFNVQNSSRIETSFLWLKKENEWGGVGVGLVKHSFLYHPVDMLFFFFRLVVWFFFSFTVTHETLSISLTDTFFSGWACFLADSSTQRTLYSIETSGLASHVSIRLLYQLKDIFWARNCTVIFDFNHCLYRLN